MPDPAPGPLNPRPAAAPESRREAPAPWEPGLDPNEDSDNLWESGAFSHQYQLEEFQLGASADQFAPPEMPEPDAESASPTPAPCEPRLDQPSGAQTEAVKPEPDAKAD